MAVEFETIRQELEQSREKLELVMDSFPGVLYEFRGAAGKYRFGFLSGRAAEFFGELAQVALSDATPVLATLHPDEQAAFMRSVLESEQNLTPWYFEFRVPQPDGSWRWARAQSIPRRQDDETVWHGVLTDITEQRRLAETLRHRQRIEAMGELVAGVAHNFNNMLAVVLPNLDMALEETHGDTQLMLREARQATQNAAELVRQLMRIARSEPDAPPESVDLVTIVRDVGALLRRTLGSSMRLNIELPETPLRVRGVASDLNMVLLNLCFNARDAMHHRIGAELSIKLTQSDDELVLEVRDNGSGMTEATLQRLGQPFFTTKQPGTGTGLGLATVYGLVRGLGGHVDVESKVGQGSTFRLCMPRSASQTVPPPRPDPKPKRLDGLRVLVIEDEAFVREAIRRLLLSVGAEVEVAADGDGGLARLEAVAADAVLLDLNMPGTPGVQVLAELRSRAPDLPVVVLTGHASDTLELSAADTVLVKPVLRAALVDAILGAHGKRRPPSAEHHVAGVT